MKNKEQNKTRGKWNKSELLSSSSNQKQNETKPQTY